jgi:hypothetical protein
MCNRFFGVSISLGLFTGLRMDERGVGVSFQDIGMSPLLAMVNGLLGVCDGRETCGIRKRARLRPNIATKNLRDIDESSG